MLCGGCFVGFLQCDRDRKAYPSATTESSLKPTCKSECVVEASYFAALEKSNSHKIKANTKASEECTAAQLEEQRFSQRLYTAGFDGGDDIGLMLDVAVFQHMVAVEAEAQDTSKRYGATFDACDAETASTMSCTIDGDSPRPQREARDVDYFHMAEPIPCKGDVYTGSELMEHELIWQVYQGRSAVRKSETTPWWDWLVCCNLERT